MDAIGTQLYDPINSGLTRWRMAVKLNNKWTPPRELGRNLVSQHQIQPEYEDEQADGERDCPYSKSMDQPGKVDNPARGQSLPRKWNFPCPRSPLTIWLRETDSFVPSHIRLLVLHTQAESGDYLRDSTRVPRRRPFLFIHKTAIPHRVSPEFIGSHNCVPMALTAESPPAQRASKPQGSSERVLS